MNAIEKAKMIGELIHGNQKYGDEDYFYHLEQVHEILVRFKVTDEDILCAAFLHDAPEDQNLKLKLIEKYFNKRVSDLVWCVTNEGRDRKEKALKTYPKIAANQDAVTLKLADRIANVENSIRTSSTFINMYRKEQAAFKYHLCDDKHNMEMWNYLDTILKPR